MDEIFKFRFFRFYLNKLSSWCIVAVTLDHSIHACLLSRAYHESIERAWCRPFHDVFARRPSWRLLCYYRKTKSIGKNNYLQCVLSSVTYISFIFCSFYRLLLVCELYFVDMRPALSHARKLRVLFLLIALSSFLIIVYEGSILMISDHGKYYFCRGRAGYSRFQVTGMIEWGQKSKLQKIPGSKIDPRKIPCRIFQYTALNVITRNLKTLEIE